jgi:hypothetical protein
LGATPKHVYIDGIAQFDKPFSADKGTEFQRVPNTPDFDKETVDALKYDGLPPLEPKDASSHFVFFTNVGSIFLRRDGGIREVIVSTEGKKFGTVIVENGTVICAGTCSTAAISTGQRIDLEGGSIS